jgi:hypothetical protein
VRKSSGDQPLARIFEGNWMIILWLTLGKQAARVQGRSGSGLCSMVVYHITGLNLSVIRTRQKCKVTYFLLVTVRILCISSHFTVIWGTTIGSLHY